MKVIFPNERLALTHLKTLPADSSILDIGCSSGRLVSRLTDRYRCFGMEPNLKAAAEAQAKGIEMLGQNDWPRNESSSKFDAIGLVDVFEHLSDPLELLSQANTRLNPGGY